VKDNDKTLVKSIFNSISVDDDSGSATPQVDGKGAYVFAKEIGQIKLDDNKRAILSIDRNKSYEFIVKEENDKLKIYLMKKSKSVWEV
jgi:hypothetical protein